MTSGTVFDLISNPNEESQYGSNAVAFEEKRKPGLPQQNGTPEQDDFQQNKGRDVFDSAKDYELPPEETFADQVGNAGKNLLKAGIRGVHKLGRMMGPTFGPETVGKSESEIQQHFSDVLDEVLPSFEGGYFTKSLERGIEQLPTNLALPGGSTASTVFRTGAAGGLGETAERLGLGPIGQTIAELSAYIGPDLAKQLLESKSNKEIIDAARKLKLTDAEITPLIQPEFKQKWLSKLASRRGRTQNLLDSSRQGLQNVYSRLRESESAKTVLDSAQLTDFVLGLDKKLFDMPASIREKISVDTKDLFSKPITGDSLINYWQDINANLGPETAQLANLKEPIRQALSKISPQLANDFEWTNRLYSKYKTISGRLKPNLLSDIMSASQGLKLMGGLISGYYPVLVEFAGEQAARTMSRELLLNPRLQNLSGKMVSAMNQNKWRAAEKILDTYINEIRDIAPDMARQLQTIDFKEIEDQD